MRRLFADTMCLHPGAGPKGADIARPAEFLLDSNGIVRWVNLTENIAVRARPEQVLQALNQLSPLQTLRQQDH